MTPDIKSVRRWWLYNRTDVPMGKVAPHENRRERIEKDGLSYFKPIFGDIFEGPAEEIEVMPVEDHDRIVAEKDARIAKLKSEHEKWRELDAFLKDDGDVPSSVYESAVKGRRDFRQALKESREELARLRASESKLFEALREVFEYAQDADCRREIAREALAEWEKGRG